MSRYTNDVDTLREALSNSVVQMLSSGITVVGTFVMMLVLSPVLTLLIVAMLVVMLLVIKVVGGRSSRNFKLQQKAVGEANGYIEELIEGQREVKVFAMRRLPRRALPSATKFCVRLRPMRIPMRTY